MTTSEPAPASGSPSRSTLPLATWQSEDEQKLVDLIDRHIGSVHAVVFVQPTELHLPSALRRATEVIGPCSFRVDCKTLPAELIDQVSSVARSHPMEIWYHLDGDSTLAKKLRRDFPIDTAEPEFRDDYRDCLEDLEVVAEELGDNDLWIAVPPEHDRVIVMSRASFSAVGDHADLLSDDARVVKAEIEELHRFFVAWFKGDVPDTDSAFARFTRAVAADFELIDPRGTHHDRPGLTNTLRSAYGSLAGREFKIWIENMNVRSANEDLVIATYEEWQQRDSEKTARLSTAVFQLHARHSPGGVEWRHVHETWLSE